MALVKEDVYELLIELKSFGIVEKVALDGSVGTNNQQLWEQYPFPLPLLLLTRELACSCSTNEIVN